MWKVEPIEEDTGDPNNDDDNDITTNNNNDDIAQDDDPNKVRFYLHYNGVCYYCLWNVIYLVK